MTCFTALNGSSPCFFVGKGGWKSWFLFLRWPRFSDEFGCGFLMQWPSFWFGLHHCLLWRVELRFPDFFLEVSFRKFPERIIFIYIRIPFKFMSVYIIEGRSFGIFFYQLSWAKLRKRRWSFIQNSWKSWYLHTLGGEEIPKQPPGMYKTL